MDPLRPDDGFARTVLETMREGVYYVDCERRIASWNRYAGVISGFSAEEVLGRTCAANILRHVDAQGRQLCTDGCPLQQSLRDGMDRDATAFLHHKNGHRIPVSIAVRAIRDQGGDIVGAVEIFSNVTNRSAMLEELERLRSEAYTDALTGLGNRRYGELISGRFRGRLEREGSLWGAIFADLDDFKKVNDTYGHETGDKVLKMAANSILAAIRPLDAVARWGGEEFLVFLSPCDEEGLRSVAERIRMLVESSFIQLEGGPSLKATVSLGASLALRGEEARACIDRADEALYQSKRTGKNRVTLSLPAQP